MAGTMLVLLNLGKSLWDNLDIAFDFLLVDIDQLHIACRVMCLRCD